MSIVFDNSGGFLRLWRAQDSYQLFKQAREAHLELFYVHKLVQYLCC